MTSVSKFFMVVTLFVVFSSVTISHAETAKNEILFNDSPNQLLTNAKQMTFVGPRSGEGYFSADGKKMIFQSERQSGNPFYQMYITDLASGKTDLVSTGQGQTTCGWIHPNMKTAMWSSTHLDPKNSEKVQKEFDKRKNPIKQKYSWAFDENFSVFSSDLNGKNIKQLTRTKGYNAEGSYSPDGKHIAFASNRKAYDHTLTDEEKKFLDRDASYFMDIYIMDADGKNVKQLTNTVGYDGGPFFSADGKKITWRRFTPDGSKAEIYTMNIDGTEQKQITKLNSMSWAPFFHPSGDYIIFATAVLGFANFELFIVDSAGAQKPVRVTFTEGFDGLGSFSPDGKTITWSHRNEKGDSQIYLASWNDAEARKLLNLPHQKTQNNLALSNLSPEIKESDAKSIVEYLADPEFKGRATGSEEEKIYTAKISDLFKSWGLKPALGKNFIQTFEFISGVKTQGENTAGLKGRFEKDLKLGVDYQIISYSQTGKFQALPIVFAGYGVRAPANTDVQAFDSYKDLDVKNKWVFVLDETPRPSTREFKKHTHLLSFSRLQHKITVAKNLGAAGLVVISDSKMSELKFEGSLSDSKIPVLKITKEVFENILKTVTDKDFAYKNLKSLEEKFDTYDVVSGFQMPSQYLSANINLEFTKSVGRNVLALLEPKNKTAKSKAVLIGAHGDHLGFGIAGSSLAKGDQKGLAHLGADDNASGVAGVLELAHAYSKDINLKKPILFAVWSGEEIGVLGSTYFVKHWKGFGFNKKDFNQTFEAGINMDMIGRYRDHLFVQGVGSALEWPNLAEKIATTSPLSLALTNDPYLPTDSMSVYLGNVPSITFFTGAHSEYHTPNDTASTLNYAGLFSSIQIVQRFADQIVHDSKNVLTYQKVEGNSGQKLEGRSFRIFLGTIPDYSQEGIKGVRISGAAKDSPAERAGLKAGDVILEFDQTKIENIYDYVYTLQSVKPNIKTKIKVLRNNANLELDITPLLKE